MIYVRANALNEPFIIRRAAARQDGKMPASRGEEPTLETGMASNKNLSFRTGAKRRWGTCFSAASL